LPDVYRVAGACRLDLVTAPPADVGATPGAKVLVVEDSPDISHVLRLLLSRAGYAVHSVADGEAAIRELDQLRPHVAIIDVQLPGMSGLELCRAVREGAAEPPLIMLLTARASEHDAEVGRLAGADAYVTKPFNNQELLLRLEGLLRGR
jgi:DNA-binding response OmpR family regulator